MYQFILNMWVFDKIKEEEKIIWYASKGIITQQEATQIIATPKNPSLIQ